MESASQVMWSAPKPLTKMPGMAAAISGSVMQHAAKLAQRLGITRGCGHWRRLDTHTEEFATWHPPAVLRAADERRDQLYRQLMQDLRDIQRHQSHERELSGSYPRGRVNE